MKSPMLPALLAGSILLSGCTTASDLPKSTPSTLPNGEEVVHTPVVGLTTVTKKTDADNPY